jgi:DNA polymerase-3 subunit alpha
MSEEQFKKVFTMIVDSGKYAFNSSHAVAYAMVGYTTAYYKYYYPKEFIASTLSYIYLNGGDVKKRRKKIEEIFNDARELGIKFLPPDIEKSSWKFTIEDDAIRIGLCAITSFSEAAYNEIIEKCVPFESDRSLISQIHEKVQKTKCGKRALIPLIFSGALGEDTLEIYKEFCTIRKEEVLSEIKVHNSLTIKAESTKSDIEEALLEVAYTNYPANNFAKVGLDNVSLFKEIKMDALVTRVKTHKAKNGTMAFMSFDTGDGVIEVTAFADTYKTNKKLLKKGKIIKTTIKKTNKGIIFMGAEE